VSQDSVDDWGIFDETDDFHHTLTFAAHERIDFENLFDQAGPVFPALLAKLSVFAIRPVVVWLESTSGRALSTALADVRISPVASHKLLSLSGMCVTSATSQSSAEKTGCASVFLFGYTSHPKSAVWQPPCDIDFCFGFLTVSVSPQLCWGLVEFDICGSRTKVSEP
jgi:hypothetical protein